MHKNFQSPRGLLIASVVLAGSLVAAPASQAAGPKRCKAAAAKAHAKVKVKGPSSLVASRGSEEEFTLTHFACLYSKPKLYKIPGQNGGGSENFSKFTLKGRYVAYEHLNAEEASTFYPAYIELVDLKLRKKLYQRDAFPLIPKDDNGTVISISKILLRSDGAVAWTSYNQQRKLRAVLTVLKDQAEAVEVDKGKDIEPQSLKRVTGDSSMFSWVRGGAVKTAPFGGS
jgi:hypothetical protein